MEIKCFTKNETGYNSHFKVDNYDFSSENEWRYVPAKAEIDGKLISENSGKYLKNKDLYNRRLERYSLKFEVKDIECIFVESKKQISETLKIISIGKEKIRISNWSTKLKK